MALCYSERVPDLRQLLDETGPEQLGLFAGCFPGHNRGAIACHFNPSVRIGAKIQAPRGVVVAAEIESADRVPVSMTNVCDHRRPRPAGATTGGRKGKHRLSTGEQEGSADSTAGQPEQKRVHPADLGLDPAQSRQEAEQTGEEHAVIQSARS
jgi:hypothetical protein